MFYNHPLLLFANLILIAFMTLALFISWRHNRSFPGIKEWFWGYLFAFLDFAYFMLNPSISDVIPQIFSDLILNSLFITSGFFAYVGCRKLNNFQFQSPKVLLIIICLTVFSATYFDWRFANNEIGFILASVLTGLFFIMGSLPFYAIKFSTHPIRYALSFILFLHGIFTLFRPLLLTAEAEAILLNLSPNLNGYATILLQELLFTPLLAMSALLVINEENFRQLRIQAEFDSLTNIRNRRSFLELLHKATSLSGRLKTPLAILTIDLDGFKSINDQYGHIAGDQVLKAFCTIAEKCIRSEDGFGRIGGEEFAMYLINTDIPTALTIAERIRSTAETSPVEVSGKLIHYTASIGVTKYQENLGIESALGHADKALYLAKQNGRNRTELAAA